MKILVINCGSSSLKYQLIDMTDERVVAKGLCERIGIETASQASIPIRLAGLCRGPKSKQSRITFFTSSFT